MPNCDCFIDFQCGKLTCATCSSDDVVEQHFPGPTPFRSRTEPTDFLIGMTLPDALRAVADLLCGRSTLPSRQHYPVPDILRNIAKQMDGPDSMVVGKLSELRIWVETKLERLQQQEISGLRDGAISAYSRTLRVIDGQLALLGE